MNKFKQTTVLFFGISGAGKGTQANLLTKFLEKYDTKRKTFHVTTGDLARNFVKENGFVQDITRDVLETGGLFPSFLPIYLWGKFFIENFTGSENLILDGMARRPLEADALHNALVFLGVTNHKIIFLELSDDLACERLLLRGRGDDTKDSIKRRLEWFRKNEESIVKAFEENGLDVIRINGEPSIEIIHKNVLNALGLQI